MVEVQLVWYQIFAFHAPTRHDTAENHFSEWRFQHDLLTLVFISDASMSRSNTRRLRSALLISELKKRRWQRQRHKSMIWLVEWGKAIVLHVRHAFWWKLLTQSADQRREIFIFEVLTTTRARSTKSFIFCLGKKTIRTKQAKVQFANFVQRDQHGIMAKQLT